MDGDWVWLAVLVVLLLVAERLYVTRDPRRVARSAAFVAAWLIVTGLALSFVHTTLFVAEHALLFTVGREVATVALIPCAVVLIATPIVCWLVVQRGAAWLSDAR